MVQAVVFDAYGTLFNVQSVAIACDKEYPGNGEIISRIWRQKQLEYTWLRPLMNRYVGFDRVNRDGLRFALRQLRLSFDEALVEELANTYLTLPPHHEVPKGLRRMTQLRRFILSNGTEEMLTKLVQNNHLEGDFEGILSADGVLTYKPDPAVYTLAVSAAKLPKEDILFVSSNGWDVAGAKSYGFTVAWVNRKGSAPEELDVVPDYEVRDLVELTNIINS
ncbi:haloacid dehalogenase type II [Alicyclobacillus ferrooxydans]|uniref:Haloacid dehalogenase n=1 Tax=Alicyclobacillus ferrooxydans TaxID=471514 RepID=A0A0P9CG56_9BACL|nr:haloacid dehalogenase type II [Alicyclobacillus ferrooxydans]KPV44755.1 haloacid dehalogenase [Alicyclobacillus ferrooxydans]